MYKAIYEYEKISKSMRLKVSLTLKHDPVINNKFNNKIVDKFTIDGSDYLKITPFPFLVIDIRKKRSDEEWSPNDSVSLTQYGVFVVKRAIKKMLKNMETEDLFMYVDGRLVLNKALAEENTVMFTAANKHIMLSPVVVQDENEEYEGISFMINSYSNYALLTFEEAEFLYDVLNNTQLSSLGLDLMLLSMGLKSQHSREVKIEKKPIKEKEDGVGIECNFNREEEQPTIPDI